MEEYFGSNSKDIIPSFLQVRDGVYCIGNRYGESMHKSLVQYFPEVRILVRQVIYITISHIMPRIVISIFLIPNLKF